jgi:predicted acylesterase/phospholipase RssA
MTPPARSALVLQGGGALGAYELGTARALYKDANFAPEVIAGVSIGAVTAVLLARPAGGRKPLDALEAFWNEVTVPGLFFPSDLRQYASFLGNRNFFLPRVDYFAWPTWTYFYDTAPLRRTLEHLVDLGALADTNAVPRLLISATNLKEGQIEYFYSQRESLTLDHVMASGSLPPAFPMTTIGNDSYWDGGLFDNTPLGAVIDKLDKAPDVHRTVYVVNLFPNKAPIPRNLSEIAARMKNLQFANKTLDDVEMMRRMNEVAKLMEALEKLPGGNPLQDDPAYIAVKTRAYVEVPEIVSITPPEPIDEFGDADFSPEAIKKRANQGYAQTMKALAAMVDVSEAAGECPEPSKGECVH